jgi:hypothetical protein
MLNKFTRLFLWGTMITATAALANAYADETKGIAKVSSEPSGANVYVDGNEYGPTPVFIELVPGKHQLTVSLDGYPPKSELLTVVAGRAAYSQVKFKSVASPSSNIIRVHDTDKGGADAGPGTVNVATDPPGLQVFMNKEKVSRATPVSFDIAAGTYLLTVVDKGETVLKKTVFVRAGRTMDLDLQISHQRKIDETDPWK